MATPFSGSSPPGLDRQLLQGQLQDSDVIGCGIGVGVAGAQDGGQGLLRVVQPDPDGEKAEPLL